jgi:GGDEF domain-containing protein
MSVLTNNLATKHPSDRNNPNGPEGRSLITALIIGSIPERIPGIVFNLDPRAHSTMIAVTARVDPSEVVAALGVTQDPALPIADFAANRGIRRDFEAGAFSVASFAAACAHFKPIWERLAELPFRAPRQERAELTALRLAYTRDMSIEASFAPDTRGLIDYVLLGVSPANRERLESLTGAAALRRRHFTRTHSCIRCGSARLLAYEACPGCGGADLADERIVHHYRCGWQAPESQFIRGRQLVCPKCRRELRQAGMDYGKPGMIVHCRTCGAANAEPDLCFSCLDCSVVIPGDQAPTADWYHYDLTEVGLAALREGRLPTFDLETDVNAQPAARSMREFKLLAIATLRSARQFGRRFAVAELSSPNLTALRDLYGPDGIDAALRQALAVVIDTVSQSEFVAVTGNASLLIGFPETAAAEAKNIADKIRSAIALVVAVPLDLTATVSEDEAVSEVLDRH